MQYGICHLNILPVRFSPVYPVEILTQLLYGYLIKVIENRKNRVRIKIASDSHADWINKKQFSYISEDEFKNLNIEKLEKLSVDSVLNIRTSKNVYQPIIIGSRIKIYSFLSHKHESGSKYPK